MCFFDNDEYPEVVNCDDVRQIMLSAQKAKEARTKDQEEALRRARELRLHDMLSYMTVEANARIKALAKDGQSSCIYEYGLGYREDRSLAREALSKLSDRIAYKGYRTELLGPRKGSSNQYCDEADELLRLRIEWGEQ